MFEIMVQSHFSAAHNIRSLHGKCENLHGHNWRVEVSVGSKNLNPEGLVIDFEILKQKLDNVLKELDHKYLNDLPYFSRREPSSENIAKFIFTKLNKELKGYHVKLKRVSTWESDTSCAIYYGEKNE